MGIVEEKDICTSFKEDGDTTIEMGRYCGGMGTVVGAMGTVGVIASEENEVGSIETGRYRRGHSGYCGYACV